MKIFYSNTLRRVTGVALALLIMFSGISYGKMPVQAASIDANYAKLLQESLYFYDANMCGNEVSKKSAFAWRNNCHAGDTKVKINGKNVNVSGGFHDAGDHIKLGLPQGYTATILGIEYMEFKKAFTDTSSAQHLKRITTHFCEYFERCTVLKSNGKVDFFVYQVSDGDEDHKLWSAPETQNEKRHVYYTSKNNPATDEVSEAAAALALQYINFGDKKALKYSKLLFDYAKSFDNKSCATWGLQDSSTGGLLYDSKSWGDDYALAAALLYKATKQSAYKNEFDNVKRSSLGDYNIYSWFSWDNVSALADYYGTGSPDALKTCADNMKGQGGNGYVCLLEWGSARYNCNIQLLGLLYDKAVKQKTYLGWATGQMKYLLGDNPQKRCYVVGYNSRSVKYPHHRAASGSTDAGIISPNRHVLLGALVGGPKDSNGNYTDSQSDYQCNEVALDYNAGLVGAAAGLYLAHKNDTNASVSLITSKDIKNKGLRFNYGLGLAKPKIKYAGNNKKKTVTLKWTKKKTASGYEIQYSTKANFKNKKTLNIKNKKIVSTKLTKLKKGRKYYIRIRAYKKVKGVKQYSAWSARKIAKIKK